LRHLHARSIPALPTVGRARDAFVVDHDRHAIRRLPAIHLDEVGPGREGCLKRRQRVLGRVRSGTAVADDESPG
jgi:hypothetical protein